MSRDVPLRLALQNRAFLRDITTYPSDVPRRVFDATGAVMQYANECEGFAWVCKNGSDRPW